MEKLKCCPVCGEKVRLQYTVCDINEPPVLWYECEKCGCELDSTPKTTVKEAIEEWNRKVDEMELNCDGEVH